MGDLVMVVKACCDRYMDGTVIFRVAGMRSGRPAGFCNYCWKELPHGAYAADAPQYPGAPVGWLKRIPPLGELEGQRSEDEMDIFDFLEA